ncbi:ATP-binding protein [Acrocarpospora phusangensis]|uniref:ATP-binding protein n=1 Tax=Acrocarpospora phusangensis TaxID=1070424 RepID=UPI0023B23AAA|nr:ATP-binding protein [Acrocarpospora phusangensis]
MKAAAFVSGDQVADTREQGAGLGLSIVASIAEAHGGLVWADRNPGGGLTLVVNFGG